MSSGEAMQDSSFACATARCNGAREALIVALLLYALAQSAEALAGNAAADVVGDLQPMVGGTPLSLSFMPAKSQVLQPQYSKSDFQRRGVGVPDATAPQLESSSQTQPLQSTSAWQRLADYRAQGRVQLLTLWESRRSTLSLQAGHHGGPSLQWSSRLMNRGGATRGLLDRFVASSLGATALGSKIAARNSASAPSKSANLLPSPRTP